MSKIIWGNCIVKNEDKYIWFAVKSVINYLEKLLIFDTGSTDKTVEIIQLLRKEYPEKIFFEEKGKIDAAGLSRLRQKMLDETESDWMLLLDGDEVWWEDSIKKTIQTIDEEGENLYAIVNPTFNLVGDIFHYQEEKAGEYEILGNKGHFNIRAINRKIPGLHIKNAYPFEGFFDGNGNIIQSQNHKLKLVKAPILHCSFLKRSSIDDSGTLHRNKVKLELGLPFPDKFKFPEVFYLQRPEGIENPFKKMGLGFKLQALMATPFRRIKRRLKK